MSSNPVIGFGLEYAGQLVFCEAVMQERHYDILFDGQFMCTVELTDNFDWILSSGTLLPQATIDEIGFKIESNYE